jgi:hypothetical protein
MKTIFKYKEKRKYNEIGILWLGVDLMDAKERIKKDLGRRARGESSELGPI